MRKLLLTTAAALGLFAAPAAFAAGNTGPNGQPTCSGTTCVNVPLPTVATGGSTAVGGAGLGNVNTSGRAINNNGFLIQKHQTTTSTVTGSSAPESPTLVTIDNIQ